MIDYTKGIYQSGHLRKVFLRGVWCNIDESEYPSEWSEVQAWLAKHPKYVVADDMPPEPTPGELAAAQRATVQADLARIEADSVELRKGL